MDESWGKFQERKGECSDLDEQNDGGDDDKKWANMIQCI